MKTSIIILLLWTNLFAHPHFFIDSSLKIDKKNILHMWKFDKLNSKLLMFDFDINKNQTLEDKEQKEFIKTHFLTLKKDNFNMFIETNEKEIIAKPKNIKVIFKNKHIVLSFNTQINFKNEFTLCTIDPLIYMAYKLKYIETKLTTNIQKSNYDYCIGVK